MINKTDLFKKKQQLVQNILTDKVNDSLFKYYDYLVIKKRFNIAKELSHMEQILTIDTYNLSQKEILNIIKNFISDTAVNLFDIIKISNLPSQRINSFSKTIFINLGEKFSNVSRETNLIGVDFSLLRALDNFIIKIRDVSIKNTFQKIKKNILIKMLSFDYIYQKDEIDSVYLCWIDRILFSVVQHEFDIKSFINLTKKLLKIIPQNLAIYWKILHTINYLCFQPEFDDVVELRKFKRDMLKIIKETTEYKETSQTDIEQILINTLADPSINKEKFYYLFDAIKVLAEKTINNKNFCLNVIDYLIYTDKKQGIFNHRFIREAFFTTFCNLIFSQDDLLLKEKELCLLLKIFNIKYFFYYNKKDIIDKISTLLSDFNKEKNISCCKFYRYLDIADYVFANNKDFIKTDIIEKISLNSSDYKKIYNRFSLFAT